MSFDNVVRNYLIVACSSLLDLHYSIFLFWLIINVILIVELYFEVYGLPEPEVKTKKRSIIHIKKNYFYYGGRYL